MNNSQTDDTTRSKRVAMSNQKLLQDFGFTSYVIDENVGYDFFDWDSVSCMIFVKRNASEHDSFIRFTVSTTCACCSSVGKQGNGDQNVYVTISKNCHAQYVILHELLHDFSINPYDLTKSTIQAKRGKNGQIPKFGGSHVVVHFSFPTDHTKFDKPFRCECHVSVAHGARIKLNINLDIIFSTNCESNYT